MVRATVLLRSLDVDELANHVLVRAFRAPGEPIHELSGWLHRITGNPSRDRSVTSDA